MKKLLLILLCLPMIGFGQVKNNKSTFNFNKSNDYTPKNEKVIFNGKSIVISDQNWGNKIIQSFRFTGYYKEETIALNNNGATLDERAVSIIKWMIENTTEYAIIFSNIKGCFYQKDDNNILNQASSFFEPLVINVDNLTIENNRIEFKTID